MMETNDTKTIEPIEGVPTTEFIDDNNYENFRLLSLYNKQKDIDILKDKVTKNRLSYFKDENDFDYLNDRMKGLTEEDLKTLPDEEINRLFDGDGEDDGIELAQLPESELNTKFKRDFLIFQKQADVLSEQIEEEQAKLDKELEGCRDELNKAVETYTSMPGLIKATLQEKLEQATDEAEKNKLQNMLDHYTYGLTLNNMVEYFSRKPYIAKRVYSDFALDGKRSQQVFERYKKECNLLKIEPEFPGFIDLEKRFLPEKYQVKDNLFMYAVIDFIASWYNKNDNPSRGLFITEFTINIKNLYYNKFESEDDKSTFVSGICRVLDLILD